MRLASLAFVLAAAGMVVAPAHAADGATLAADHGCLNCHGVRTHPHEAPLLKDLAAKIARRGSESDAVNHALHEMREKTGVHGHVFVSDETAIDILRWMAQGAKQP